MTELSWLIGSLIAIATGERANDLRELRDRIRNSGRGEFSELSMGTSRDFEVAIEEGATLVRLGTILLGERPKPAQTP